LRGRGSAVESSNIRFVEALNAYGAQVEPADVVYFPDPDTAIEGDDFAEGRLSSP